MHEERTQNYDKEYPIHDTPCHIIYSHVQYSTAINTSNYTERQQFCAMTVSLKSGFLKVFF